MYVAISDKFLHDVEREIRNMGQKESAAVDAHHVLPELTGSEEFLLRQVWKKHLHLKDVIPRDWSASVYDLSLEIVTPDGKNWRISHRLAGELLLPPKLSAYGLTLKITASDPGSEPFIAYAEACLEVQQRWGKVHAEIIAFLKKCKSLNEALKLWPQIEAYIPDIYMQKANGKREATKSESKAAEAVKDLDTEGLMAAAVISRMS